MILNDLINKYHSNIISVDVCAYDGDFLQLNLN